MWQKSKPYVMVFPAAIVIVILFFGGILEGLKQSLGFFPAGGQSSFTLSAYTNLLFSHDFWVSLALTLRVSLLSTALAALLGLMMAICLFILQSKIRSTAWIQLWKRWFQLPFVVPHLSAAYLIVLLLTQSGWMSRMAYHTGLIEEMNHFPIVVNDQFGMGMILTYVWKEAPFILLCVYPVLHRIHDSWRDAARVFGASSLAFIKEIVLPLLLPAWFAASFIVFVFTFSAFEVPYLLGVTYPKMLPVLAYEAYSGDLEDRPEAMAIGILLVIITAFAGWLAFKFGKKWMIAAGRGWS